MLPRIPDSDGVQQLLNHMVEEDADRRAQESGDHLRGESPRDGYGRGDGGSGHRTLTF